MHRNTGRLFFTCVYHQISECASGSLGRGASGWTGCGRWADADHPTRPSLACPHGLTTAYGISLHRTDQKLRKKRHRGQGRSATAKPERELRVGRCTPRKAGSKQQVTQVRSSSDLITGHRPAPTASLLYFIHPAIQSIEILRIQFFPLENP